MSSGIRVAFDNGLGNVTVCKAEHGASGGSYDTLRSVLVIVTADTQTITDITAETTGDPGGWTLYDSHTAQGWTLRVYEKTCDASEVYRYDVTFSPPISTTGWVATWLRDFAVDGDPIRAAGFADAASGGTTLTLPSLTVTDPDFIFALVVTDPDNTTIGQLEPQSPLVGSGQTVSSGTTLYIQDAGQIWHSNDPTGTRFYQTDSGTTYERAIGVMLITGEFHVTPVGGWGVGQVRMGGN